MIGRTVGGRGSHGLNARLSAAAQAAAPRVVVGVRPMVEPVEARCLLSAALYTSPVPATEYAASMALVTPATTVLQNPSITTVSPANNAVNVARDVFIACDLNLPNVGAGVNQSTLYSANVHLVRTSDGQAVSCFYNTSGGGDDIVVQPRVLLDANTQYTFSVTSGVKDTAGASFLPFTSTFTTGTAGGNADPSIAFSNTKQANAPTQYYTCVKMGPDGKLYASTFAGLIYSFPIGADGTLGAPTTISTVRANNINSTTNIYGLRTITGFTFDSAGNIWLANNEYDVQTQIANDWTGKISVLSGPGYTQYRDAVVHLPRSIRDHQTDQPSFGPDGALYWGQAAENSFGAADKIWGNRPEHVLSGAVLRLDVKALGTNTLDALTSDGGGTYNPKAAGAPLTIYAEGIRNGFDLLFHSNGSLYVPSNGSSSGGNTPAGGGAPALTNLPFSENDYLFKVATGANYNANAYYGHPNPTQNHFVLNGGNPTGSPDPFEVTQYPVGIQPDANWVKPNYDFGKHVSPDGIIEYTPPTNAPDPFGGKLDHQILAIRYSGGSDIMLLGLDASGNVISSQSGIAGFEGFNNPLDLTEDPKTGNIYVAEYGANKIDLLKPLSATGAHIALSATALQFNEPIGGGVSKTINLTITNTGSAPLAIPGDGLSVLGADATQFLIKAKPVLPTTIAAGQSVTVSLAFAPPATTALGTKLATLQIKSNDPSQPLLNVSLRGLATKGQFAGNEPSLQQILNLFQIPVRDGQTDPNNVNFVTPPPGPTDEVLARRFVKAGAGSVTVTPIATFVTGTPNAARIGYYAAGSPDAMTKLFNVAGADQQTVNPTPVGVTSFDPGSAAFGLYCQLPHFSDSGYERAAYSEDALNAWDPAHTQKMRAYPLKDAAGNLVPNAYVVAFEDYNVSYDFNDVVAIVRNVKAIGTSSPGLAILNPDKLPYNDRFVFNRIQHPNPTLGDIVHDTDTVRIVNTGRTPLTISSITASTTTLNSLGQAVSAWQIVNPPPAGTVVAANGGVLNVQVKFVAQAQPKIPYNETNATTAINFGGVYNGTLTVNGNDPDAPSRTVQLAGWWQDQSEHYEEPSLQTLTNLLWGWKTNIASTVMPVYPDGTSTPAYFGEETKSAYWAAADPTEPVLVRQIAAWHNQGPASSIEWYRKTTTTPVRNFLYTVQTDEAQSFFPTLKGSLTTPAVGSFYCSTSFGWWLDGEFSDDAQNHIGLGGGHHTRFYPVRDRAGNLVPNTYLATNDYSDSGIYQNFDFQDNVWLVTNMRPEASPAT